ncbi:MAG: DNA-deoxyinosine glycosylase [Wenzhouxiangellaceae bacterium]
MPVDPEHTATDEPANEAVDGDWCSSFAPVWRADARVLILGSVPGRRSLAEQRYYAHPRNAFWQIVEQVCGVPATQPYGQRLQGLIECGVALWDVIGRCRRRGSLDQRIERETIEVNPVGRLLGRCPELRCIVFNGAAAETAFRRHVLKDLAGRADGLRLVRLPSTSAANAMRPVAGKVEIWRATLEGVLRRDSVCGSRRQSRPF